MSETERDPVRELEFATSLVKLGAGCRQEVDDLMQETYIEALCYQVTPEEWTAFVRESNRCGRYQWFPKIHELLEDLAEFRQRQREPQTTNLLPAPPRTAEEAEANERAVLAELAMSAEQRRENARRGLELIREALGTTGDPVRSMPSAAPVAATTTRRGEVTVSDERLAELRRQAAAIAEEAAVTSESVAVQEG